MDIISVTETWLNDNVRDNKILPSGYNIRKDRPSNKRGGGVLALRNGIQHNRVASGTWSNDLEILVIELLTVEPNKCLLCVCYKSPNSDLNDWLDLFMSLLQVAEKYEKILITGDFNFPDLIWDCDNAFQTLSSSSIQFRDLIQDFFLEQVSLFLTRSKNILDLIIQ